jgi:hypothetical protein
MKKAALKGAKAARDPSTFTGFPYLPGDRRAAQWIRGYSSVPLTEPRKPRKPRKPSRGQLLNARIIEDVRAGRPLSLDAMKYAADVAKLGTRAAVRKL